MMADNARNDWAKLSEELDHALELNDAARSAWLAALERDDPLLAARIIRLLSLREHADFRSFLEQPPPATADAVAAAAFVGRHVGPYVIEAEIGRGGMGSVWRAKRSDGYYEGTVAIKFVRAAWAGGESERRFRLEGALLGRLDHPNIARLLDAGVIEGNQPYLVLEYVEGDPIDVHCESLKLDVEKCVRLFLDALAAVAHAHRHLIVHRDLKPSNILVSRAGAVKLLDFGIARLLQQDDFATPPAYSVTTALTPLYAAPEQLLGEAVTTATDVYALGLVLYVLLTGEHPLAGAAGSSASLVQAIVTGNFCRASAVASQHSSRRRMLAGDLDNILGKALKTEPAERYASVGAFADDLQRYLGHEPVRAGPDTAAYRVAKFVRRHRGGVASAMLTALVMIGATITTSVQMVQANRARAAAQFEARRAESINEFLDVLLQSDGGTGRPPLTAQQRLELGVRMIESQYRDDPRFAGRMLVMLSDQFRGSTETSRSIELADRAYDLGVRAQDIELMVSARCAAAYEEAISGVLGHAPERLAEAGQLLATLASPAVSLRVDCMKAEAELAVLRAHSPDAERSLLQAKALLELSGETYGFRYTTVLNELGGVYNDTGRLRDALTMSELIGATHERFGRGGTSARAMALQNQATILYKMGEIRTALQMQETVRERLSATDSADAIPLSVSVTYAAKLARVYRLDEALAAAQSASARARSKGNVVWLIAALRLTCDIEARLGNRLDTESAYQEYAAAQARDASTRWAGSNARLRALIDLQRGDAAGALASAQQALAEQSGAGHEDPNFQREALLLAARAELALSQPADAQRDAQEALRWAEGIARGADTSADVGEALLVLAKAQRAAGQGSAAQSNLERALRSLTNALGVDHPLTRETRELLARPSVES